VSYLLGLRESVKNGFRIVLATLGIVFLLLSPYYLHHRARHPLNGSRNGSIGDGRQEQAEADAIAKSRLSESYGRLPLHFESNKGQTDGRAHFISRGNGYNLFLTPTESVLQLRRPSRRVPCDRNRMQAFCVEDSVVLRSLLLNSNESAKAEGLDELPGKTNYFVGKEPDEWVVNVSNYARVTYSDVYPGIDVIYYGNQRQLEHDFIIAPGSDPQDIAIRFLGAEGIRLDANGDLIIHTALGDVKQKRPVIYQESEDGRRDVAGNYVIKNGLDIGFRVGDYDRDLTLVIDPVLTYSTYLGGSASDLGGGIAVDSDGQVVVAGFAGSSDFPLYNGYQSVNVNGEAFITKLNSAGTAILYSTFFGGGSEERVTGLAVDNVGNSYISGFTYSDDLPTVNAFSPSKAGQVDVFIAKLNDTGSSLLYSSYLGGSVGDFGRGVAADNAGNVYVTGITDSTNFPTKNALKSFLGGSRDGFVAKVDTNQAGPLSLTYSTYVGGTGGGDYCEAIAVDPSGNIYVTGRASELSFPLKNAYQSTDDSYGTAFITKLDPSLPGAASLLYSSFFGGNGGEEIGYGITADALGRAYITGSTWSSDFLTRNAFQDTYNGYNGVSGHNDAFVTIFDTNQTGDASLLYSTYLGGNHEDLGRSIKVDESGIVYVVGDTSSGNFPVKDAIQDRGNGRTDVFITKLRPFVPGNSALLFSTYLGGSSWEQGNAFALDNKGGIYVTGNTESENFPTLNPLQASFKGFSDAFIVKLSGTINSGTVLFAQTSYSVSEGAGSITLSVTRTGGNDGAISVQYTTTDGTAMSGIGGDFTAHGLATLHWAAGDSSPKEIMIPITADLVFEGAEQFSVVLSNPTGGATVAEPTSMPVTIIENDDAPVFGFQHLGQEEGNAVSSNFGIFITKTGNTAVTATLDYQTIPGTATPGSSCDEPGVDYITTSGTLTFLPQETTKLLRIVVCGGTEPEPEETFSIPFVNPVNGIILPGTGTSNIWIANDDKFTPTVVASIASYTFDGTGHAAGGSATGNDGATLSPAVTFSYSGMGATTYPSSSTPPSAAGTYQVVANFPGNSNYTSGSSVPVPYTIYKATPLISWGAPTDITYGTALSDAHLNATATVPGNFNYTPAAGVVLNAGGDQPLSVSFTPDDSSNYDPASASVTINVRKAAAVVNAIGGIYTYDGQPHPATGSVVGVGGQDLSAPTFTYNGSGAPPVNAGSYAVIASFAGDDNYEPASDSTATVTINKAAAALALSGLTHSYDGTQKAASVTITPLGLSGVVVTYDGLITPPTNAASYTIVASLANQNFAAPDVTGTLVIDKAATTASIASSLNPSVAGQPVTFTMTVAGPGGPPTGSVEFFDGVTSLGSAPLMGGGTASLITSALPAGARSVTGVYIGGANFFGSATPVLMQVVAVPTPAGRNVSVTGSTEACTIQLTYSNVTAAGTTTVTPIDPSGLTTPGDFAVDSSTLAFDISTTATFRGQITICFQVPTVTDQATFNSLRILHYVNGKVVAEKITTRDWATKTICTVVNSLSPFAVIRTRDFTPPEIGPLSVDKQALWPANHKMVDVTVRYSVTDNYTPADELAIALSVTSNEPENGVGDGDITPDWEVVDGHHVRLRAERAGAGSGRAYTITVTAIDRVGNTAGRAVTVSVPKSQ
jgi:Calx-beta domain/Bacterial Ig-like domain (group 3)/MBG domain/Beta-propeller repeat